MKSLPNILIAITIIGSMTALCEEVPPLRIISLPNCFPSDSNNLKESAANISTSPTMAKFTKENKHALEFTIYENRQDLEKKLKIKGFYDVAIVSHDLIPLLARQKRLQTLSPQKIPSLKHLSTHFGSHVIMPSGETPYAPYLIGFYGIIYRQKSLPAPPGTWNFFYNPTQKINGKISLPNDADIVFPTALMAIGAPPDTQETKLIKEAGKLLFNAKTQGYLETISDSSQKYENKVLANETAMAVMNSGAAFSIMNQSKPNVFNFVIPQEGGGLHVKYLVILEGSKRKVLAEKFVDYILKPEIQAANAITLGYFCPNIEGRKLIQKLAPSQLNNPMIYPPDPVLKKLRFFSNQSPEIKKIWSKIFK